jgi:hypothetical protein
VPLTTRPGVVVVVVVVEAEPDAPDPVGPLVDCDAIDATGCVFVDAAAGDDAAAVVGVADPVVECELDPLGSDEAL